LLLFRPHRTTARRRGRGIRPYASIGGEVFIPQVAEEWAITAKISRSNRAFKLYAGKAGAIAKSVIPNAGNAGGYGNAGKSGATGKSVIPNAGNAGGYGYAGKSGATGKSAIPNAGNAVR